MSGILDRANVLVGDGQWSAMEMVESVGGLVNVKLAEICSGDEAQVTGGTGGAYEIDVVTFGIDSQLVRPTRCASGSEDELARSVVDRVTEQAVGQALFVTGSGYQKTVDGASVDLLTLKDAAIHTETAASTVLKLLKCLDWYYAHSLGMKPIVHLGRTAAADIANVQMFANGSGEQLVTGEAVSLSVGYPTGAIAVTGPIGVRLGNVQTNYKFDSGLNRTYIDALRLAAFAFDPEIAVTASTS
jgi:hypothetical protein